MAFLALISGGKDGLFAAGQCVAAGRELLAVLHLRPAADWDELDSHMFQSVGCEAVESIARCLGKPLLQRRLRGGSRNTALEYCPTEGDEVEDLTALVAEARAAFPAARALCSGAIASLYQKNRVESVCARAGLEPLAPLWGRAPEPLLREMLDWGLRALLVRVCADGLDARHLGLELGAALPVLLRLAATRGLHVCGEGGEFETLVLDCPLFTAGRLEVLRAERVVEVDNGLQFRGRLNLREVAVRPI